MVLHAYYAAVDFLRSNIIGCDDKDLLSNSKHSVNSSRRTKRLVGIFTFNRCKSHSTEHDSYRLEFV